ncbi:hypothetical protein PR202_ga18973 [Eleusine coracana subsp. coracana]|uniref:MATH domain-containing protein n=1 Tax=Eleusine coracana subsp. coracana TaxID=191504 RepID=A0AAV5CUW8_ELECO|nr:hypothetical protein PR202_ga18973 [Eleusine coracana subsp. coracana]
MDRTSSCFSPVNNQILPPTSSRCLTQSFTGTYDLKLANLSKLDSMGIGKFVHSGNFTVGGCDWDIRFYPEGSRQNCTKYASAFVIFLEGAPDTRVKFSLSLLLDRVSKNKKEGEKGTTTRRKGTGEEEKVLKRGSPTFKAPFETATMSNDSVIASSCMDDGARRESPTCDSHLKREGGFQSELSGPPCLPSSVPASSSTTCALHFSSSASQASASTASLLDSPFVDAERHHMSSNAFGDGADEHSLWSCFSSSSLESFSDGSSLPSSTMSHLENTLATVLLRSSCLTFFRGGRRPPWEPGGGGGGGVFRRRAVAIFRRGGRAATTRASYRLFSSVVRASSDLEID